MSKKIQKKRIVGTTLWVFSVVLFFGAYHNLDLMANRVLLYNDINSLDAGARFLDARDISDCNLFGCHDYQLIYMVSNTLLFISFGLAIMLVVLLWN